MNPSTWQRAKSLLADAATLPPAERERFVIEQCPDPVVQREVLALLASPAPLTGLTLGNTLQPGVKLGPYVIEQLIGRGGMGEVYKANDLALNRAVAIKVLPTPLVDDSDRQARFRREAQILAALNHPNIAHIHGFEQSTGVNALVMELVDGPTLADRLRRTIPLPEVLSIAAQVIDALDAAHAQGIIHRDLKPANIKVREDGTVKVLDFGLARTLDLRSAADIDAVTEPTWTGPSTQQGLVVGTPAYMAPEQAVGKLVDRRADIWSFGCVLFEMLTAQRAFPGADISETLARVIGSDPDWTAVPPTTPTPLLRLLHHCLEKPINRRLADIADARLYLADASVPATSANTAASAGRASSRLSRTLPWTVAATLATVLVAMLTLGSSWRSSPASRPMQLSVDLGTQGAPLLLAPPATFAISGDGAYIAFTAVTRPDTTAHLYARPLDHADAAMLPGTEGAIAPFFSPDGQWIAFFAGGKLKKIAVTGGSAIPLCDAPLGRGGAWTDDGAILFSPAQQESLWRVSAEGGTPERVTRLEPGEKSQRFPQLLPGGQAVLYSSISPAGNDFNFNEGNLVVQTIPNGPRRVVMRGAFYGRYSTSGHLLYMHNGTLFAAPFDLKRLEVTGRAQPLSDALISNETGGSAMLALSNTGTLAYVRRFQEPLAGPITWLDRTGRSTVLRAKPSEWSGFAFAPEGRRLAVMESDGKQADIWIDDINRDAPVRLTHFNSGSARPAWTPDGKRVAFSSMLGDTEVGLQPNLHWMLADGSGAVQRLTTSANAQAMGSWHPQGRILAFTESRPRATLMLLELDGDEASGWQPRTPTVFLGGDFEVREPAFSRDGRWIAYESNPSGKYNVYVRPFPGPGSPVQVSTDGGTFPTWSQSRPELIYATLDQRVMIATYGVKGDSFEVGQLRPWPEAQLTALRGNPRTFALHPDGDRLVLPAPTSTPPVRNWERLDLLLNFSDELRRIAPAEKR